MSDRLPYGQESKKPYAGKDILFLMDLVLPIRNERGLFLQKMSMYFLWRQKARYFIEKDVFAGTWIKHSYAIFQDATGKAYDRVVALGIGIGSGYLFETTFKKEVYSDLTGERGTLMGAIQGIFAAQYEVLRKKVTHLLKHLMKLLKN